MWFVTHSPTVFVHHSSRQTSCQQFVSTTPSNHQTLMSQPYTDSAASQKLGWVVWLCSDKRTPWKLSVHNDVFRGKQKRLSLVVYNALYKIHPLCRHTVQLQRRIYVNERNVMFARLAVYRFSILKSSWQRAGNAAYMPHSQQRHAYKNNTHKTRRNLKTKCNDNKKEKKITISIWYVYRGWRYPKNFWTTIITRN